MWNWESESMTLRWPSGSKLSYGVPKETYSSV